VDRAQKHLARLAVFFSDVFLDVFNKRRDVPDIALGEDSWFLVYRYQVVVFIDDIKFHILFSGALFYVGPAFICLVDLFLFYGQGNRSRNLLRQKSAGI
jgi:hypothetical protein